MAANLIRRAAGGAAFAAAALLPAAGPALSASTAPAEGEGLAGQWELSLLGTHRKCRLVLAPDGAAIGRMLRFPVGCRRALPVLAQAAGWLAPAPGILHIIDQEGRPALEFSAGAASGTFVARQPSGEGFLLEPSEKPARDARPPKVTASSPLPSPAKATQAPPRATLPGLYAVDRPTEREVCRVALGSAMLTASGRFEARLLDGCRDAGLAAFDPIAWSYEEGRLILVARGGHEVTLVSEREGSWRRQPEVGSAMFLRKAE